MLLLQTPNPEVSSEECTLSALGASQHVLNMRRIPGFVDPKTDPRFYELAFPTLFPYGKGGPNGKDHGMKPNDLQLLLIKRGGDRRFSKDKRILFTFYSFIMRKQSGTVSYLADLYSYSTPRASATADESAVGSPAAADSSKSSSSTSAKQNTPFRDAMGTLKDCPTAQEMIQALTHKDNANLNTILGKLQPFASNLPGSILQIAQERRLLFSMMASDAVNDNAELNVFATVAPCDRLYPSL
jgi:hypothetical protein